MNSTDWKPPTGIDGVAFLEIYDLFANSHYGEILRQGVRYGLYKPEELSNMEWVKILGPDVNNLEHLKTSLAVVQDFVYRTAHPHKGWQPNQEIKFSRDEEELLCLAAVIHDWGEAITGDIQWHRKTAKDEEEELKILENLIEELGRHKFTDLLVEKMYLAVGIAFRKDEKLSPAFNAIEHIGYAGNAFQFWRNGLNHAGALSQVLLAIAKKLVADHYPTWQQHEKIYPGTHYFLQENEKILKKIQESDIEWRDVPILANS